MFYEFVEIFANLVDVSGIYIVVNSIYIKKENYSKKIFVILIIIQSIILRYSNVIWGNVSIKVFLLILILTLVICKMFYKIAILKLVKTVILYIISMFIIEVIIFFILTLLFNLSSGILLEQRSLYRIVGIFISKTIVFFMVVAVARYLQTRKVKVEPYSILALIMMLLSLSVFFISADIYSLTDNDNKVMYIMIITSVLAIINIITLIIIRKVIEISEKETTWKLTKKEYQNLVAYLDKYQNLHNEIKALKHDFTNHIISIREIAEKENNKSIIKYTKELLYLENEISKIIDIDNKVVSALINYKNNYIKERNIKFNFNINIPKNTNIEHLDLAIILGNLLDNAIEACSIVQENKRYINLNIKYKFGKTSIIMENSMLGNIKMDNNKIITSKKDKENHGYGLLNIRRTVEKYEGIMKLKDEKDKFTIEILI